MSLTWKIVFLALLGSVAFLLVRDLSRGSDVVSVDSVLQVPSFSVVTNYVLVTNILLSVSNKFDNVSSSVRRSEYLRGDYVYHSCGSLVWVDFDGSRFSRDSPCEFGRVALITKDFTICISDDFMITTYLLPSNFTQTERGLPSLRSTSSGDGKPRARYYVHTGTDGRMD